MYGVLHIVICVCKVVIQLKRDEQSWILEQMLLLIVKSWSSTNIIGSWSGFSPYDESLRNFEGFPLATKFVSLSFVSSFLFRHGEWLLFEKNLNALSLCNIKVKICKLVKQK